MKKEEILKKAGIKGDFDRYIIEETEDSYEIFDIIGDIRGCILVGTGSWDINSDGLADVVNSKVAMQRLIKQFPQPFTLEIR